MFVVFKKYMFVFTKKTERFVMLMIFFPENTRCALLKLNGSKGTSIGSKPHDCSAGGLGNI